LTNDEAEDEVAVGIPYPESPCHILDEPHRCRIKLERNNSCFPLEVKEELVKDKEFGFRHLLGFTSLHELAFYGGFGTDSG